MLTTNSLKQDLQHTNQYINSLALGALTNGSPIEVVRSLIPEVEGLLRCSNPFIRKKAALAAAASVRRIGAEAAAALLPTLPLLCNDKSHGVLLGACALIFAMYDTQQQHVLQQQQLQQLLPPLAKALRACSSPTHPQTAEYDIAGIVDPLLQARLLRAIALLAQEDIGLTAGITELLAHIATNTDASKNAGNSVLFECVRSILALQTDQGLRVLAVNILSRFLSSREPNLKYVAIDLLQQLLRQNPAAVSRHRDTLLECLKDADSSIRRRSLEVLLAVLSVENICTLGRELLSFLFVCEKELKPFAADRLAAAAAMHAPNRRWQFDATVKLLSLAGNHVEASVGFKLLQLISRSAELQPYAVHKLFFCLRDGSANNPVLAKTALYCVGEFGEMLVAEDKSHLLVKQQQQQQQLLLQQQQQQQQPQDPAAAALALTATDVVDTLQQICIGVKGGHLKGTKNAATTSAAAAAAAAAAANGSSGVAECLVTCLAKLAVKLPEQRDRLVQLLQPFTSSSNLEVQQRSTEYAALLQSDEWQPEDLAAIFARMPVQQQQQQQQQQQEKPIGEVYFDLADLPPEPESAAAADISSSGVSTAPQQQQTANGTTGAHLLELDDLLGLSASPSAAQPAAAAAPSSSSSSSNGGGGLDLLADLLAGASVSSPTGNHNAAAAAAPAAAAAAPAATAAAGAPTASADPFAGLIDLANPLSAAAAPAPAAPAAPAATAANTSPTGMIGQVEPLSSLLESSIRPLSPSAAAVAAAPAATVGAAAAGDVSSSPLAVALSSTAMSPPSPAAAAAGAAGGAAGGAADGPAVATVGPGGVAAVQVLNEEGLVIMLECCAAGIGACEVVATFAAAAAAGSTPLQQFRFEAAVPKYLQLQLEPPSATEVTPGGPPVRQRLRITSAPAAAAAAAGTSQQDKPLLLKCRVTYIKDSQIVQKSTKVASFPSSMLGS
ncbi:gamma-adaptin, putative [Eimeria acervulina]|uniref:AP-1 complex subunit gamma n=1 Tax=Eimeria acervulina TaxID=5801 RepID=U6GGL6_EIMAC|nr:gamma-adaptin, putative [Eimeria acervulina]CDI78433.1 gamma-adaptin, putative [Eimeria acervulina]